MTTRIFPAEFIFPGHPDKLCDAIADALVQEAIGREARALVGVEVAVHRDCVYVTGRIACEGANDIDVEAIVRGVYRSAGYGGEWLCLEPIAQDFGKQVMIAIPAPLIVERDQK